MTKKEFDAETNLENLLKTTSSNRKLRLFAVACCREIQHLMNDPISIKAVDTAELFADGLATKEELKTACVDAWETRKSTMPTINDGIWYAKTAAWYVAGEFIWNLKNAVWDVRNAEKWAQNDTKNRQISLFREVVNPFAKLNPKIITWNNNLIPNMTQGFYDTKNFNDIPILADALEEAGCTDIDILSHCRNNKVHVKGCWVIDLILGKS